MMEQSGHISLKNDKIMKYKIENYEYFDERAGMKKIVPSLYIEDHEQYGDYFLTEILNLSLEYLNEIVSSLEQVFEGKEEQYDFGYEVYSIECKKDISQVIDTFNDWKCIAEIPTEELYELTRDWRDYLIKF